MNPQILVGFSHFEANRGRLLHCTAHSHHPWPDCTRAAQLQAWEDAATQTDAKWSKVFGEVLPEAQAHIARELHLSAPEQVVFAPNTHEFVVRMYSCLDWSRPIKVLTTAHEFHSFSRQTRRLEETGRLQVTRIEAEPYATFSQRFAQAAKSDAWDMVWFSQVQFDSGFIVRDLQSIVAALPEKALCVADAYHSFMAMPVNWQPFEKRVFYVAGGYKYAMAGEGACFLVVPQGCELRPVSTGWYADFAGLSGEQSTVGYAQNGARFYGATFDPSALYRFNAVQRWLQSHSVNTAQIHAHAHELQAQFIHILNSINEFADMNIIIRQATVRGNYLTFDLQNIKLAENLEAKLTAAHIRIDRRGSRIRFGFGIYQDARFVEALAERLRKLDKLA